MRHRPPEPLPAPQPAAAAAAGARFQHTNRLAGHGREQRAGRDLSPAFSIQEFCNRLQWSRGFGTAGGQAAAGFISRASGARHRPLGGATPQKGTTFGQPCCPSPAESHLGAGAEQSCSVPCAPWGCSRGGSSAGEPSHARLSPRRTSRTQPKRFQISGEQTNARLPSPGLPPAAVVTAREPALFSQVLSFLVLRFLMIRERQAASSPG